VVSLWQIPHDVLTLELPLPAAERASGSATSLKMSQAPTCLMRRLASWRPTGSAATSLSVLRQCQALRARWPRAYLAARGRGRGEHLAYRRTQAPTPGRGYAEGRISRLGAALVQRIGGRIVSGVCGDATCEPNRARRGRVLPVFCAVGAMLTLLLGLSRCSPGGFRGSCRECDNGGEEVRPCKWRSTKGRAAA
jgi:hypothetical protein